MTRLPSGHDIDSSRTQRLQSRLSALGWSGPRRLRPSAPVAKPLGRDWGPAGARVSPESLPQQRIDEPVINVIDVRPARRGGQWHATCECGLWQVFPEQAPAWRWLTEHRCPAVDLEETRPHAPPAG